MKKVVAVLLIVATLCLPLCGLADTRDVVNKMFDLTDEWISTGKNEFVEDMIIMVWVEEADCFAFAYDGENYLYNDHNAELLMATCLAAAVADDDLVYGVDWIFSVNTDVYTERQTKLYVLSLAAKYLNGRETKV